MKHVLGFFAFVTESNIYYLFIFISRNLRPDPKIPSFGVHVPLETSKQTNR